MKETKTVNVIIERQRGTQTETDTERQKDRYRETDTDRKTKTDIQKERHRMKARDGDRDSGTDKNKEMLVEGANISAFRDPKETFVKYKQEKEGLTGKNGRTNKGEKDWVIKSLKQKKSVPNE